ncbi:MAG TPA: periplasmic heavy metal sensor [Rhizomicrobium sp.]|jgi:uncharacterized membrane protein|nr:periplasmic heavy metal sensor [Rhizomicrobium sp.]
MSESAAAPSRRPGVLLIASLCLNVALIGLVAIALLRIGEHPMEPRGHRRELGPQAVMRMVPAERDKIRPIVAAHRPRLRELRSAAMRAREESVRLLGADTFDAAAFAQSLAAVEGADAALQSEIVKVTAESVAVLTPKERQAVAEKMQNPRRPWLKRFIRRH